ncbi:MAG: ATP-binding protein [Chloroflexota bacterium]|nr:ATP-binding protein [Chloroflexota bacterium]
MPAQVYGERDQLTQALVVTLDNALKYTPQEGHVALSLTVVDTEAVIKVSDTGIGIAEEDLPRIFERFYRAHQAQTHKHSGSGLGLAIVQSIMREHNGTVGVESTQGVGSTFTLRLPLAEKKTC